jgi:glycosyltransferase involved in cell wall biosynthesis
MKVLLIGPVPPPIDGCSNSNKVLHANLVERQICCEVVNTNSDIITNDQGRRFSFKKALKFFKNYRDILQVLRYDVIYFTPGQTFYGIAKYAPFILACLIFKKPYIIHVHGNFLGKQYALLSGFKEKFIHFLISRASAGIVITESLKENFRGLLAENKVFVVSNFVEEALFSQVITKKDDKLRILYLSNLMREKGIIEFLDALIELDKKQVDFEAYIAGAIELGLENEVHVRFDQLKEKLSYLGVVTGSCKLDLLIKSNVFILPTYYAMEGLPVALLEAIATGNIIISTSHAGIGDTVKVENGFLIDKQSSKAIVACIEQINANLKAHVVSYSGRNINYGRIAFTENRFVQSILDIMGQVCSNKAMELKE